MKETKVTHRTLKLPVSSPTSRKDRVPGPRRSGLKTFMHRTSSDVPHPRPLPRYTPLADLPVPPGLTPPGTYGPLPRTQNRTPGTPWSLVTLRLRFGPVYT